MHGRRQRAISSRSPHVVAMVSGSDISGLKKEKKRKKKSSDAGQDAEAEPFAVAGTCTAAVQAGAADAGEIKKKKKKRKLEEGQDGAAVAESTGNEAAEKPSKKKKRKEVAVAASPLASDSLASETVALPHEATPELASPPKDPAHVDNFPLSPAVKSALQSKGIETLFPIQAMCLQHVLDGFDVVGRAR